MTITVQRGGTTLQGIRWVTMDPLSSRLKYKQHEIDGADYDIYHVTGSNSPTTTLVGVYERNATNNTLMRSLPGSTLTVIHPTDGTVSGLLCLECNPAVSSGGMFVTVSLTLVQV